MKKFQTEFENIYQYLYKNYINDFQEEGKKIKSRCYILLIFLIMILLIGGIIDEKLGNISVLVGIILYVIAFIYGKNIFIDYCNYAEKYKNDIVTKFIKLINNKLQFRKVDSDINQIKINYNNANFDEREYNSFCGDDYIEGYLDENTYLKLADLNIQKITSGARYNCNREVLLQGIFAFFNCNKDKFSRIRICKNKLGMIKNKQENKIEINNPEFEEAFDIFTEDKNYAIKILTQDIRKMLLNFNNLNKFDFEILLTNNTVYFRFFTGSLFETKIFKDAIDKEILYIEYSILKFIEEFNKKINDVL